jgi:hypothetical protein
MQRKVVEKGRAMCGFVRKSKFSKYARCRLQGALGHWSWGPVVAGPIHPLMLGVFTNDVGTNGSRRSWGQAISPVFCRR